MLKQVRPALVLLLALTALTGLVYPLAITGVAQVLFPAAANGSLVAKDGTIVGSSLIGQAFAAPGYFHGRPSATLGPDPSDSSKTVAVPYNAANSMGSNLGPTSKALSERVAADLAKLKVEDPGAPVPVDLLTTSGSGLDPDISPEAAYFQVPRIARARGIPEDRLRSLVATSIQSRLFGVLGEPRVNVLALNLALDDLGKAK
jgi:K+-transporting ATPase ATPase C chain